MRLHVESVIKGVDHRANLPPLDVANPGNSDAVKSFVVCGSIERLIHPYQQGRASITGLKLESGEIIKTGRLVWNVMVGVWLAVVICL